MAAFTVALTAVSGTLESDKVIKAAAPQFVVFYLHIASISSVLGSLLTLAVNVEPAVALFNNIYAYDSKPSFASKPLDFVKLALPELHHQFLFAISNIFGLAVPVAPAPLPIESPASFENLTGQVNLFKILAPSVFYTLLRFKN